MQVAPHTIDSSDCIFNAAYARVVHRDQAIRGAGPPAACIDFAISATEVRGAR
mgnify:CR=1 FL=1